MPLGVGVAERRLRLAEEYGFACGCLRCRAETDEGAGAAPPAKRRRVPGGSATEGGSEGEEAEAAEVASAS
jgi:hypothetical protein